jgi:hypothetical protein
MEKVNHPSRGVLRQQAASAQLELAGMKTPEGLAAFLFSKKDDEEFQEAVRVALDALKNSEAEQVLEEGPAVTEPPLPTNPDNPVVT